MLCDLVVVELDDGDDIVVVVIDEMLLEVDEVFDEIDEIDIIVMYRQEVV